MNNECDRAFYSLSTRLIYFKMSILRVARNVSACKAIEIDSAGNGLSDLVSTIPISGGFAAQDNLPLFVRLD